LLAEAPLEHGLAELVTYLSLDDPRFVVVHDDLRTHEVRWVGEAPAGPVAADGAPEPVVRVARRPRATDVPRTRPGAPPCPPAPPGLVTDHRPAPDHAPEETP